MLTRDAILDADDLPREEVSVPEWGGSVFVRAMTAAERDRFEAEHLKDPTRNIRARVAAATVCDADGGLTFAPADAEGLGRKSAAALDRIFPAACRLSGLSKKDVDELEGN